MENGPERQKALHVPTSAELPGAFSQMNNHKYNHMKQRKSTAEPCLNSN